VNTSERGLLGTSAVLFAVSATITVAWCGSMSSMPGMEMPGGWIMSMAWMRMPGQSWPGAALTFLGMWAVMMVAMMLPALVPMLRGYQRAVGRTETLGTLTTIVGLAYFLAWTAFGAIAYPLGLAFAELSMRVPTLARAAPLILGLVVTIAGVLQFTTRKARQLDCCRAAPTALPANASSAFRHGLTLGSRCIRCCLGLTATLLALGVMDLRAMAAVTLAISAERLGRAGVHAARTTGAIIVAGGLWMIVQALIH